MDLSRSGRVFCAIWLVTALVFAYQAFDSYKSTKTELARFSVENPTWGSVAIMGIDLGKTLAKMTETNNSNVTALEESIRSSAWVTFWLNIISCVMASAGFAAQLAEEPRKDGVR